MKTFSSKTGRIWRRDGRRGQGRLAAGGKLDGRGGTASALMAQLEKKLPRINMAAERAGERAAKYGMAARAKLVISIAEVKICEIEGKWPNIA